MVTVKVTEDKKNLLLKKQDMSTFSCGVKPHTLCSPKSVTSSWKAFVVLKQYHTISAFATRGQSYSRNSKGPLVCGKHKQTFFSKVWTRNFIVFLVRTVAVDEKKIAHLFSAVYNMQQKILQRKTVLLPPLWLITCLMQFHTTSCCSGLAWPSASDNGAKAVAGERVH